MATNTLLTNDIILKEGIMHLTNNLVASKLINRDYEAEFGGSSAKNGATIRIARPIRGQIRTGATMQVQDVTEARTALTVGTQIGADLEFTSADLTLSVDKFSERVLKPQMIKLANYIDGLVVTELTNQAYNWVGTPGTALSSATAFFKAPARLDDLSVPTDSRVGLMCPTDFWGMAGGLTSLYLNDVAGSALKRAKLPMLGNVDAYMSQNVISHTNGSWGTSAQTITTTLSTTYASAKDTTYLSMSTQIKNMAASGVVNAGDVFTISSVFAVNPITKNQLPFLQQFVVQTTVTASGGVASITISPAIIASGPYQTVSNAAPDAGAITWVGSTSTTYTQSLCYHKDAATLAMPALQKPQGAAWSESRSYDGFNLRLVQGYDIVNDIQQWRFDCLVGVLAHQPNLITRVSGS
ncbi:MAG TPA: P22 phage major capsid protein family protein [Thiobacillus sp.]